MSSPTHDTNSRNLGRPGSLVALGTERLGVAAKGRVAGDGGQQSGGRRAEPRRLGVGVPAGEKVCGEPK